MSINYTEGKQQKDSERGDFNIAQSSFRPYYWKGLRVMNQF